MKRTKLTDAISATTIGLTLVTVAPAQAADTRSEVVALEEITITAEKRADNIQKTAISVSAITGETIDQQGRNDINDVLKDVPGVTMNNSPGGNYQINIRGIAGGGLPGFDGDPAASLNLDGSYSSPLVGGPSQLSFYDVARVEVLRGPQGTLYGRNSESGAINVITGNPGKEFDASGTLEFGSYSLLRASGMINVPISDSWAMRGAFMTINRNGYFSSGGGSNVGSGGRVKLQYDAGDSFRLLLGGEYGKVGGTVGVGGMSAGIAAWGLGDPPSDPYDDVTKNGGLDGKTVPGNSQNNSTLKLWAQLDWDTSLGTLTILPAHVYALTSNLVLQLPMGATTPNVYQQFPADSTGKQDSLEARLVSSGDSKLQWIGGLFYLKAKNRSFSTTNGVSTVFVDAESIAGFGQATYSVSDNFRLIGGVRETRDEKSFSSTNANLSGFAAPYPGSGSGKWNRFDYKLGVEFDVSDSSLLYATLSTGYRPGAIQTSSSALVNAQLGTQAFRLANPLPVPNNNLVTKPEQLTALELGSKNQFFDNRLRVNGDVYYYDYKDRQYSYFTTVASTTTLCPNGQSNLFFGPDTVCLIELNANKVRMIGAELETQWLITANDQLDASIAFLDAKANASQLVTLGNPAPVGGVTILDINGKRMPKSPKLQGNLSYQHSFNLAGGKLTPKADAHYVSKHYLQAFEYLIDAVNTSGYREGDKYIQNAYTTYDLSLNYSSGSGKWNVNAYMKNVDEAVYKTITDGRNTTVGPPRTFGVVLSMQY